MRYIDARLLPGKGVLLLPGIFAPERIHGVRESVARMEFAPFSYSVLATALPESRALLDELDACGLLAHFAGAMGGPVACNLNESWLRKRFAPVHAPRLYQPNSWHQDGGLGVAFTPDPSAELPMTRLLTCWIPLDDCGRDRPGLEFLLGRMDSLLHYTELDDQRLRRRFAPDRFWAPELRVGDALVFLDGCLHRTYVRPEMTEDRLSVEYRFFPIKSAPSTMES